MIGCTTLLQQVVNTNIHVHRIPRKIQINGYTHGEVMFAISVKQARPLSPTLFGLYMDNLENIFGRDQ